MEVFEVICTRRSIGLVTEVPPPQEVIEKIVEAGIWAPNHYRTEPWRYFILTGDGRKILGETLAAIAAREMENPDNEENRKRLEKERQKPFRAPVIIAAAVEPGDGPKVILKEEYAAVYAGIQNMLLAAHGFGLGAIWRTGKPCYDPEMRKLFGLSEKGEVFGFIYLGYPKREAPAGKRKALHEVCKWIRTENDLPG